MTKYRFGIQAYQEIEIEADNVEEARRMIIDHNVDTLLNTSCDDLTISPYVSDGEKI